ncbi:MAG: phytanoyl-CoA dioxygenase family protein [Pirellulales bacterium]
MSEADLSAVKLACDAIEDQGFAVLENVLPAEQAERLVQLVKTAPNQVPGHKGWDAYVALLNHDVAFADLVGHPLTLAIVRHLLGGRAEAAPNAFAWDEHDQIHLMNCDALVAHPGSESGYWHLDPPMGQLNPNRPVPDFPLSVNVMWLLTDYNKKNGATRVLPRSHLKRQVPPPTRDPLEGEVFLTAPAGSVAIVPNTIWHVASPNRTDRNRVAVACCYVPWWINRLTPDCYPITEEVYRRLPEPVQAMTKFQLDWNMDFR